MNTKFGKNMLRLFKYTQEALWPFEIIEALITESFDTKGLLSL